MLLPPVFQTSQHFYVSQLQEFSFNILSVLQHSMPQWNSLWSLFCTLSIQCKPACAYLHGLLNPTCLCAQTALWPQMWLVNCTSKEDKSTQQYFIHQGNLLWITASLWLRLFLIYCFYSVFNHKWAPYEVFTMKNWQLFLSTQKIFLDNNLWLRNILSSLNSYIIFFQYLMMQYPL